MDLFGSFDDTVFVNVGLVDADDTSLLLAVLFCFIVISVVDVLFFSLLPLLALFVVIELPLLLLLLCLFICLLRWSLLMNRLEQTGHTNFFSPVCVRKWRDSSSEREKDLLHDSHLQT